MKSNGPSFDTEPGGFRGRAALFPDVDVARDNGPTLLGVQSADGHGEHIAHDGIEDLVGVSCRANADVGEGWSVRVSAEQKIARERGGIEWPKHRPKDVAEHQRSTN